jgi:hypothetical protein
MSGILKTLQAAHDKRSASSRMTNVVCSTAVFPDEFEVASELVAKKPVDSQKQQLSSPLANSSGFALSGQDMSPTNSCRSDETPHDFTNSEILTSAEQSQIVQQVQWNVEMMKLKLLELFEAAPASFEAEDQLLHAKALQEFPTSSDFQFEVPGSRPSSGTKPRVGTATSKVFQHACIAVDGVFRFAFEEIALRWHGLQDRPFSLRGFHQVAKEQIRLRNAAQDSFLNEQARRHHLEKEVHDMRLKAGNITKQHEESIKNLLTENRVLRQRVMDLQAKLKIDEPVPHLYDARVPQSVVSQPSDENQAPIDPNEKHYESLNRRLTEECMLLAHTLEQRNVVVKTLSSELNVAKQFASSVRDEFRRFVSDQESADVDFRKTFTQNEQTTDASKKQCAEAVARASEAEGRMESLAQNLERLSSKIDSLEHERQAAVAERDHLRARNDELVSEAEKARDELEAAVDNARKEAEIAKKILENARARIEELENDGTRSKLEVALADNVALQDKVKTLQRAVESRDRQIQSMRIDHKQEVNKLEEAITMCKSELDTSRAKFEDLIKREHQKGLELAAKKVVEANEKFDDERQKLGATICNANRTVRDLTHEVMLFHRQSTILQKFLKGHCDQDELRALAKALLKRDLRNTLLEVGGESDDGPLNSGFGGDGDHTPRTRLYFGKQRVFEPEDVQLRLTMASESFHDEPEILSKRPLSLLLKSMLTEEFLSALNNHENGGDLPEITPQQAKPSPLAGDFDGIPVVSKSAMIMEELKSLLVHSKLEAQALKDELFTMQHDIQSLQSAGIQTSFASAHSLVGSARRTIRSAGRSRPSSAVTHRSDDTGCDSPVLGGTVDGGLASVGNINVSFHGSTQIHQTQSATLRPIGQRAELEKVAADGGAFRSYAGVAPAASSVLDSAPLAMANEFPGVQHATEFIDLIESFYALRRQLTSLVNVCVAQAEQGSMHPNDLASAQDLLHSKFTIFRAVESENNVMLHRLHRKKEDLMRHREEELERVLSAMQNIAVTHPKESANLLRVAKNASRSRQNHKHQFARSRQQEDTLDISAVVVRPRSQQSVRRLLPTPSEVVVSGASALMSMRSRATSASQPRRQ